MNVTTARDLVLLRRAGVSLHRGDALELLRGMPAESAQCCITSPSYYGLRDYGTAKWEGGDPGCDHKRESNWPDPKNPNCRSANGRGSKDRRLGLDCARCGARRIDSQIGLESTPSEYIARLVKVFAEVRRVLSPDAALWVVIGDSYASTSTYNTTNTTHTEHGWSQDGPHRPNAGIPPGVKPKDLIGIPHMLAFALRGDGWYWRSEIVWAKPNPMPESCRDRCTRSHEFVMMFSKSSTYYCDMESISEPVATDPKENYPTRAKSTGRGTQGAASARGNDRDKSGGFPPRASGSRNKRDVWWIPTRPTKWGKGLHFASFPEALVEPMVLAGSKLGDTVLDPFVGSGTTGAVSVRLGRRFTGIDLNSAYVDVSARRILAEVTKPVEVSP
jgi:DNA modification methylase